MNYIFVEWPCSLAGASTAVSRRPLSTFFIHLPFKNYPAKVDRWLKNLTDRNESQMTTFKLRIWSVCRNTDNNKCIFVQFSSMTSNFSTVLAWKYKIWGLIWYNSFFRYFRPLRVGGRGFLYQKPTLKKGSPHQKLKRCTCAEACHSTFKPGVGDSAYERVGMLVGTFELNPIGVAQAFFDP